MHLSDNWSMQEAIVRDPEVMHGTPVFRGTRVPVQTLFDYYADDPMRLPDGGGVPGADTAQRVTDYLAGMTDRYCIRAFEALAVPESFAVQ